MTLIVAMEGLGRTGYNAISFKTDHVGEKAECWTLYMEFRM